MSSKRWPIEFQLEQRLWSAEVDSTYVVRLCVEEQQEQTEYLIVGRHAKLACLPTQLTLYRDPRLTDNRRKISHAS